MIRLQLLISHAFNYFQFAHVPKYRGKSQKRWISKDAKMYSRNLRAVPYAGKQKQWGDKKVWWFMILARGKVSLQMMPLDWEQPRPGMAEVRSVRYHCDVYLYLRRQHRVI